MKTDILNILKGVGLFMACTLLWSCSSEIEDGTTDIDSWPLPSIDVNYPASFVHPGVAFTQQDVERWQKIVQTEAQPQYEGYEIFSADRRSQSTYVLNGPYPEIYSNEDANRENITNKFADDWSAAIQCAIMFAATGEQAYANKSMEIIRGYANTVKGEIFSARVGGSDHILVIGNLAVKYVYAVELMRYLPNSGMTETDFQSACEFLKRACVPPLDAFFARTDPKTKAVGNFGASAINCYMCM